MTMLIFPAIDILAGTCVRLTQGDFKQQTVFSDNPAAVALKWEQSGAEYLHLVDLDGALAGESRNLPTIKAILHTITIPTQLGGGIRDLKTIDKFLQLGLTRVILGSIAVKDPALVKEAVKEFGSKIVVGIDAKDGFVAVEGWGKTSSLSSIELGKRMFDVGVQQAIFTDISRDGKLNGVNIPATCELAQQTQLKVIASGGVSCLDDIKNLKQQALCGIEGVIVGKAIYTGKLDLAAAIACCKE